MTREQSLENQRKVLAVLAKARFPMKRRPIEVAAFGHTGHMAWPAIQALAELEREGFVERAYNPRTGQFDRMWQATEKGRTQSPGFSAFHPSGGRVS